jgi:micrococcal nuclease
MTRTEAWIFSVLVGTLVFLLLGISAPRSEAASYQRAIVEKVSDSDTIRTNRGPVRLLGVDGPEVFFRPECGGKEASAFTKRILPIGARVRLYRDDAQPNTDRYGRLLRYLHVTRSGTNDVSLALVKAGWASVYTTTYRVSRTERYLRAERVAQRDGIGMWGFCTVTDED